METILLVNDTHVDDYIAGVVKAEGGNGNSTEYYKAQALIAYTYFVRHESRHSKDRYNVCDDVHCQVYKGLTSDKMINDAVRLTSGEVIVTPDSVPIISAFHSNCGGETSPASFAWVESVPYLMKVEDPWCATTGNASWTKKIKRDEWIAALAKGGFDKNATGTPFGFDQSSRLQFYKAGNTLIPFRDIRASLGLRSAWFSVTDNGDEIVLNGKGYGHGVGLCQEGAMKMAREGYDYISVIKYYYRGVTTLRKEYVKKPALID
jgi:stage II sporulation protein D